MNMGNRRTSPQAQPSRNNNISHNYNHPSSTSTTNQDCTLHFKNAEAANQANAHAFGGSGSQNLSGSSFEGQLGQHHLLNQMSSGLYGSVPFGAVGPTVGNFEDAHNFRTMMSASGLPAAVPQKGFSVGSNGPPMGTVLGLNGGSTSSRLVADDVVSAKKRPAGFMLSESDGASEHHSSEPREVILERDDGSPDHLKKRVLPSGVDEQSRAHCFNAYLAPSRPLDIVPSGLINQWPQACSIFQSAREAAPGSQSVASTAGASQKPVALNCGVQGHNADQHYMSAPHHMNINMNLHILERERMEYNRRVAMMNMGVDPLANSRQILPSHQQAMTGFPMLGQDAISMDVARMRALSDPFAATGMMGASGMAGVPGMGRLQIPMDNANVRNSLGREGALSGTIAAVDQRTPQTQRCVVLSMKHDLEKLSDQQCFIRKQIEAFTAGPEDITTHVRGRNKVVVVGQVGIRCVHCSKLPIPDRGAGAVYFPSSLGGVYQAAQNIQKYHLRDGCQSMPPDILSECREIILCKSNLGGGKQYWTDTAQSLGLVDTPDGIRFRGDVNYEQLCREQWEIQERNTISQNLNVYLTSLPAEGANEVVHPDDRTLVSGYLYFLLCQVRPCHLEDGDRVGYRKEQDLGMPGLECKHCGGNSGGNGGGRFFRSTAASIAKNENMAQIYKHVKNCSECPNDVKMVLDSLKQLHSAQVGQLKRGWKKIFFERVMYRLCASRDSDPKSLGDRGQEGKESEGEESEAKRKHDDDSESATCGE